MKEAMFRPVVVVTGASTGIGREVALEFARRGWRVALMARRGALLDQVKAQIRHDGSEGLALPTDVSERPAVENAIRQVWNHWNRIDVLVNNAAYGVDGFVEECEPSDFEHTISVNYLGAVYCAKAVLPLMRKQGAGCLVNVGSISGRLAGPGTATYSASKAALEAFTNALRLELQGTGIAVCFLLLGGTKSDMLWETVRRRPVDNAALAKAYERYMPTARVAKAVVRAALRRRPRVFVPLTMWALASAYALAPSWVECLLAARTILGEKCKGKHALRKGDGLFRPQPPPGRD
jgi:short-subunit dehydrogenase